MTREQQILRALFAQGAVIPCFRCRIALKPEDTIQKEHLHERALGGEDNWENWRFSHAACHAIITDGTKATSAGSSKHRIAKAARIASGGKVIRHPMKKGPKKPWPKRGFPKKEKPNVDV